METPHFATRDVGCPECGAAPHEPCRRRDGSLAKGYHGRRVSYAITINERVAADPWVRFRTRRRGGAPRAPKPCGTRSAAIRHQRRGEPLDERCETALKTWERERSRKRRGAA